MIQYILRKIIYGLLVLAGVVIIVFMLFNILPGDPARLTLGQRADVASIEAINKELGLDKPILTQFLMYVNDLSPISVHEHTEKNKEKYEYNELLTVGEKVVVIKVPYLRRSYQTRRRVSEILIEALPGTFILALSSIVFASILGVFLGVITAIRQNTITDGIISILSIMGTSVPSFFSAILLSYLFGFVLSEITGLNMTGSLYEVDAFEGRILAPQNLILPMISLGIRPLAIIVQLTRSSMLDVLSQDYIRTAVSKGVLRNVVIFKHALRNALNPVVTAVSGLFASMMAGAFFVEYIFSWKGIGKAAVDALQKSDFPVVMGTVLFTATIFVLINTIVDVIYSLLDPRVAVNEA